MDGDDLWVTDEETKTVAQADPSTFSVSERIPVGRGRRGVAVGAGLVWVANADDRTVSVVDPQAHGVVQTIVVGNGPAGITVDGDRVWVATAWTGWSRRSTRPMGPCGDPSRGRTTRCSRRGRGRGLGGQPTEWDGQPSRARGRRDRGLPVGRGPPGSRRGRVTVGHQRRGRHRVKDRSGNRIGDGMGSRGHRWRSWSTRRACGSRTRATARSRGSTPRRRDRRDARDRETNPTPRLRAGDGVWIGVQASPEVHRGGTLVVASVVGAGSLDAGRLGFGWST